MSDLCPQCGNPAYLPSDQCDVIWHTGAKPFGTSVVQDIDPQLAEQIEWVKRLADDLNAAEGREARLKAKLAKAEDFVRKLKQYAIAIDDTHLHGKAVATLAELKGQKR